MEILERKDIFVGAVLFYDTFSLFGLSSLIPGNPGLDAFLITHKIKFAYAHPDLLSFPQR